MKKRIQIYLGFFCLASLIITGCGSTREVTLEERNKELIHRMNDEVWTKGNLEIMDQLFSTDFVQHFLPVGSETKGLVKFRESVRNHRQAFPDWAEEIKQIVAEEDFVATHFTSTGTNTGSFLGNPSTGKQIHINEMSIYRIVDGKIVEHWLLPDLLSLNQQLGLGSKSKQSEFAIN